MTDKKKKTKAKKAKTQKPKAKDKGRHFFSPSYWDGKWRKIIAALPIGGDYRFDLRKFGIDIIMDAIRPGSRVFDFGCGLGVVDIRLARDKGCQVAGCDLSKVAVDFVKSRTKGDFRVGSKFFGDDYDVVVGVYLLEHLKKPRKWLDKALSIAHEVIVALPNNFKQADEHADMQWGSQAELDKLLSKYRAVRLDVGKYPASLDNMAGFKHPIYSIRRK